MRICRVRAWPTNKDYYFRTRDYRVITGGRWDIIHCQGYHNLVPPLAMFAARRAKIPFVLSFHSGGDVTRLRKALRWLQWMMLRPLLLQAQKLIAVSEFEASFFREQLRFPSERFVIIPNGAAHLPEVTEPAAKEVNSSSLIVSVGRLERYKGHQRVIAALPKVLEEVPDACLRIVGIGPYKSTLQKMANWLGVAERVDIRGNRARRWARYGFATCAS